MSRGYPLPPCIVAMPRPCPLSPDSRRAASSGSGSGRREAEAGRTRTADCLRLVYQLAHRFKNAGLRFRSVCGQSAPLADRLPRICQRQARYYYYLHISIYIRLRFV